MDLIDILTVKHSLPPAGATAKAWLKLARPKLNHATGGRTFYEVKAWLMSRKLVKRIHAPQPFYYLA